MNQSHDRLKKINEHQPSPHFLRSGAFLFTLILFSGLAPAAAQTLTVTTADGHSTTLTAAQIAAAPHVTFTADDHGTAAEFEGVPLATVTHNGRHPAR
jgi:hypothetical protein